MPMTSHSPTMPQSIVMLGATGAVGQHVAQTLANSSQLTRLSLLGRRPATQVEGKAVFQHTVDIFEPSSYEELLAGHQTAVCTLGVGQPSKMSKEEFVKIDHDAVLAFATSCKRAGVRHFELLSSVSSDPNSVSFYLRQKGKLEEALKAQDFERLSLFQPSMILTPTNRYGVSQAIFLALTPIISPLLFGPARKFRGIRVSDLGRAMAFNALKPGEGVETLHWDDFTALANP